MLNSKNEQLIESFGPVYSVFRLVTKIFLGFFVFPVRAGLKYMKKNLKNMKIDRNIREHMVNSKNVFNFFLVIKILF